MILLFYFSVYQIKVHTKNCIIHYFTVLYKNYKYTKPAPKQIKTGLNP